MDKNIGIYAGALLQQNSNMKLFDFCCNSLSLDFSNSLNPFMSTEVFHVTLLSSYNSNNLSPEELVEILPPIWISAKPSHWDIFKTKQNSSCLVLILDSDDLIDYHNEIIKITSLKHNHPVYTPHISVHYDYKELKVPNILPSFELVLNTAFTKMFL